MGDPGLERARQMDAQFMSMDFDAIPVGQPIDERSLISAASDPNTIPMAQMRKIHNQNERANTQNIRQTWSDMLKSLPSVPNDGGAGTSSSSDLDIQAPANVRTAEDDDTSPPPPPSSPHKRYELAQPHLSLIHI